MSIKTETTGKKKSLLKRWWFWVLAVIVLIIIICIASSGGSNSTASSSTQYDIAKIVGMSKEDITKTYGNPDKKVDDNSGFDYLYNTPGLEVQGNSKGICYAAAMELNYSKTQDTSHWKAYGVGLGSSYADNVKRIGDPDNIVSANNKRMAIYLTKEDDLLIFGTDIGSDKINYIKELQYDYNNSPEVKALNVISFAGSIANQTELEKFKTVFYIKGKESNSLGMVYTLSGANMTVDDINNTVTTVGLSGNFYNVDGLRVGDSLDDANKLCGKYSDTLDLNGKTQYIYSNYKNKEIRVNVDKNNKITDIIIMPK